MDVRGNLLVVEKRTTIDAIPAAAKASILNKVADGKLSAVETFTKTGQPMTYEASYADKKGKKHEVLVKADGTGTKDNQNGDPLRRNEWDIRSQSTPRRYCYAARV